MTFQQYAHVLTRALLIDLGVIVHRVARFDAKHPVVRPEVAVVAVVASFRGQDYPRHCANDLRVAVAG